MSSVYCGGNKNSWSPERIGVFRGYNFNFILFATLFMETFEADVNPPTSSERTLEGVKSRQIRFNDFAFNAPSLFSHTLRPSMFSLQTAQRSFWLKDSYLNGGRRDIRTRGASRSLTPRTPKIPWTCKDAAIRTSTHKPS